MGKVDVLKGFENLFYPEHDLPYLGLFVCNNHYVPLNEDNMIHYVFDLDDTVGIADFILAQTGF